MVETNTPLAAPAADAALAAPAADVAPVRKGLSGAAKRARRAERLAAEAAQAQAQALKDLAWPEAYLEALSQLGIVKRAALMAGVDPKMVRRLAKTDSAFAAQVAEALEDYRDELEYRLVLVGTGQSKGNPLALIARLKAERPGKYHDELRINASMKAVVAQVVGPEAAAELLRLMVADATSATLASLAGSREVPARQKELGPAACVLVIDAPPPTQGLAGPPVHLQGYAGSRDAS